MSACAVRPPRRCTRASPRRTPPDARSIVGRMDDNEDLFKKILDEPAFQAAEMDHYARRVFEGARGEMP